MFIACLSRANEQWRRATIYAATLQASAAATATETAVRWHPVQRSHIPQMRRIAPRVVLCDDLRSQALIFMYFDWRVNADEMHRAALAQTFNRFCAR